MVTRNKKAMVHDCYKVVDGKVMWSVAFRRVLRSWERGDYKEMRSLLGDLSICIDEEDQRICMRDLFGDFSLRVVLGK